jgi:uncharacterized protein (TIGR03085 family)
MSLASRERAELSDEFDRAGPDRPTLCEGWTARDLLAHLLVRERVPWAAPGIVVPALAPVAERAMRSYDTTLWHERVGLLRSGPPVWSPMRPARVDAAANGAEFVVHHEDLRRGEPGWEPRPPEPARDAAVWAQVQRAARMMYRRSPVGVVLRLPSGEQVQAKSGSGVVTLTGEPIELLLHAFGRNEVRLERDGAAPDVAALAASSRGI